MDPNELKEKIFVKLDIDGMVKLVSDVVKIPSITCDEAEVALLLLT